MNALTLLEQKETNARTQRNNYHVSERTKMSKHDAKYLLVDCYTHRSYYIFIALLHRAKLLKSLNHDHSNKFGRSIEGSI